MELEKHIINLYIQILGHQGRSGENNRLGGNVLWHSSPRPTILMASKCRQRARLTRFSSNQRYISCTSQ